jgi:hypothetical protein
MQTFEEQVAGLSNSWFIRRRADRYSRSTLTHYVQRRQMESLGNGCRGTHCRKTDALTLIAVLSPEKLPCIALPPTPERFLGFGYFLPERSSTVRRSERCLRRELERSA